MGTFSLLAALSGSAWEMLASLFDASNVGHIWNTKHFSSFQFWWSFRRRSHWWIELNYFYFTFHSQFIPLRRQFPTHTSRKKYFPVFFFLSSIKIIAITFNALLIRQVCKLSFFLFLFAPSLSLLLFAPIIEQRNILIEVAFERTKSA